MQDSRPLTLIIQGRAMPGRTFGQVTDVEVGIQRGQEVVDAVAGDAPHPAFKVLLRVARLPGADPPNFLGPYAHGTPSERFLYLSWSGVDEGERRTFGRLKIKLHGLTWEMIEPAIAAGTALVALITLTAKKGGPACGSVRDEVEWRQQGAS